MKNKIQQVLKQVLTDLSIEISDFSLEYPNDFAHGDMSSNVAMVHAKKSKQNPKALAEKIVEKLREQKLPEIEKVDIAGPGFINFYFSREFFTNSVAQILKQGENYGKNDLYKDQKIMIEHTNLNPFKIFHIGHLVNHSVGCLLYTSPSPRD